MDIIAVPAALVKPLFFLRSAPAGWNSAPICDKLCMREVEGEEAGKITFFMYEELLAFRRVAEKLGLPDRLLSETPETIDLSAPDFTEADRVLAAERASSLDYLRRNLEAAYLAKINGDGAAAPETEVTE